MTFDLPALDKITASVPRYNPKSSTEKKVRRRSVQEHPRKPRLLDLFCCAGGAGLGYSRAGFEVVGVDIKPQPNYPLPFIQADALTLDPKFIALFDAVHASPPCQSYSDLAKRNGNADEWPRLIEPVRELLIKSGLPYIIENVDGAPLLNAVVLCGTMFPKLRVLRHRLFEANFEIIPPPHRKHPKVHTFDRRKSHFGKTDEWKDFVQVTGGGNCTLAAAREAMGIDWMTKGEINESIPPAYTEFVGRELFRHMALVKQAQAQAYEDA
ncbi:MAG: DNA cytosine methyltransferase [Pseudomonadota bacterium]